LPLLIYRELKAILNHIVIAFLIKSYNYALIK